MLLACCCTSSYMAGAQGIATASRTVVPSAFVGLTGTHTGLESARNLGVTAGLDVGFRSFYGLQPSIDLRGTYPLVNGQVAGEEDLLGGVRVGKPFRRFQPYGDVLFGRGALSYQNGGFVVPAQNFRYLRSTTNVLSLGVGVDVPVSPQFGLLVDGQLEHWNTPFDQYGSANSGHLWSAVGTVGLVYRFNWLVHGHPAP